MCLSTPQCGSVPVPHRVDHHERHEVDAEEEVGEEVPDLALVLRLLFQAAPFQGLVLVGHHSSRWILVLEAWARGRSTRRSTLTWLGRVTAQLMVSATSSAVRGSATPSYTLAAFSWSPPKRVRA